MTEHLSHAEKQLAALFSRRLGPRLKQCIALVEQGFEQNWPADVFHRVHQHIDMILRGAERFGYDSIAEALGGLQATINHAAEQLTTPEETEIQHFVEIITSYLENKNILPLPKISTSQHSTPVPTKTEEEEPDLPESLLARLTPSSEHPIYIVTSDSSIDSLSESLSLFGYQLHVFDHLGDAQAEITARRPQLMVMPLPESDDLAMVHEFIQSHHLRAVFYAPRDTLENRLKCVRAGGEDLFLTPLDDYQLLLYLDRIAAPINDDPLRALVVEDSKSQGTFCLRLLRKVGMEAEWIDRPELLLDTCRQFQPEVILMDMQLPGCNGLELAAVLRQFPETRTIPIIFVSAEAEHPHQSLSSVTGDTFIEKPISAEKLVSTVLHRAALFRQTREIRVRDELTCLPNYESFMQTLAASTSRAARDGVGFALLCFEIWQLDHIRTERGEAGANRVVQTLGHLLRHRTRCSDFVARIHDNRFAVILYDCTEADADRIARAINGLYRQGLHKFLTVAENLAWGIACLTGESAEALYRAALRRLQDHVERLRA
ncbi:MAG: response regulator [Gammaproteobacteria bacterium]|nr:MAG: response regulator [Gammaproteobacteria bacterium]